MGIVTGVWCGAPSVAQGQCIAHVGRLELKSFAWKLKCQFNTLNRKYHSKLQWVQNRLVIGLPLCVDGSFRQRNTKLHKLPFLTAHFKITISQIVTSCMACWNMLCRVKANALKFVFYSQWSNWKIRANGTLSLPVPFPPSAFFTYPLPLLPPFPFSSVPLLRSRPLKSSYEVWGIAVSSPSGVWGGDPADKRFGAF